jgi:CysZ protein
MVSTSSPRAAASIFQGWKLVSAGHSTLRHSAAVDQHYSDGRRVLVAVHKAGSWIPSLMSHVPDWLQWLNYLLWPVVVISVLLVFGYFFSTIANWIAAPFNGLLAEQLEARLTGATPPDTACWAS